MKVTNGKDFWAGVMFMGFGLGFMIVSRDYSMGTAVRMGPAYFPMVLGGMLTVLGAVVFFRAFVSKEHAPIRVFPFRVVPVIAGLVLGVLAYYTQTTRESSIVWDIGHTILAGTSVVLLFAAFGPRSLWVVLAGVVMFGYLLKPVGLVLATFILIFVSAAGGHEFKWKEVTILSVLLAVFSVYAFVKGLGLPMNIWPSFLE